MKRAIVMAVAVLFVVGVVGVVNAGFIDDHSNTNQQGQQQGQIGINDQDQGQAQGIFGSGNSDSDSRATSISGSSSRSNSDQTQGQQMGQGQAAIAAQGQLGVVGQGNKQATTIEGDDVDTEVYANQWPSLSGGVGVSQANAYSIFGGLGVSSTEEYKVCIEKLVVIDTLKKAGYLSSVEAQVEVDEALKQLKQMTRPKRFLGVLWQTSGRNLLNLMGLLSWDSFWK